MALKKISQESYGKNHSNNTITVTTIAVIVIMVSQESIYNSFKPCSSELVIGSVFVARSKAPGKPGAKQRGDVQTGGRDIIVCLYIDTYI